MSHDTCHSNVTTQNMKSRNIGEGTSASYSFHSDCTNGTTNNNQIPQSADDTNICWICLDTSTEERPLTQPCKCPRFCHAKCLARWQLQSAGTKRETFCDFCDTKLPDWRLTLAPERSFNAPAIMNVNFDCKTYSFEVKPGSSGYQQFTEAIRQAFELPEDSELNITFTCDEPCSTESGSLLTLQGPGAYDAAVYCASVSAARRQLNQNNIPQDTSTSQNNSTTTNNNLTLPSNRVQGNTITSTNNRSNGIATRHTSLINRSSMYESERSREESVNQIRRSRTVMMNYDNVIGENRSNRTLENQNNNDGEISSRRGWRKVVRKMKYIYNKLSKK